MSVPHGTKIRGTLQGQNDGALRCTRERRMILMMLLCMPWRM